MGIAAEESTPAVRFAAKRNELRPAELRVAEAVLADPASAVESTAQELADRLGVARSSVIRTSQKLDYRGWPQLRVALARQMALAAPARMTEGGSDLEILRGEVVRFATMLPESLGLLDEAVFERAIAAIAGAKRLLCVANGLSAPIAQDLAMRLTAGGRPAEVVLDALGQQIAARQLSSDDVLVVISGSGANELTLRAAVAGRRAGARIVAVTSFATSPLVEIVDEALVIASVHESFRDELEHASRISHAVFLHALVPIVIDRLGGDGRQIRSSVLEVLAANLSDGQSYG